MTQGALPFGSPAAGFILIRHTTVNGVPHRVCALSMYGPTPEDEEKARAEALYHNSQPDVVGRWHVYRVEEIA